MRSSLFKSCKPAWTDDLSQTCQFFNWQVVEQIVRVLRARLSAMKEELVMQVRDRALPSSSRVPFEASGVVSPEDAMAHVSPRALSALVNSNESQWGHLTALVVEDDPLDSGPLLSTLKQARIGRVIWTRTAFGALYQLIEDEECFPDVVIVDAKLAMSSGLRLIRTIRQSNDQRFRRLPIIVTSADVSVQVYERLSSFGISAFLRKPIGVEHLCSALVRAADGYQIARAWSFKSIRRRGNAHEGSISVFRSGHRTLVEEAAGVGQVIIGHQKQERISLLA